MKKGDYKHDYKTRQAIFNSLKIRQIDKAKYLLKHGGEEEVVEYLGERRASEFLKNGNWNK